METSTDNLTTSNKSSQNVKSEASESLFQRSIAGIDPNTARVRFFKDKIVIDDDITYIRVMLQEDVEVIEAQFSRETVSITAGYE